MRTANISILRYDIWSVQRSRDQRPMTLQEFCRWLSSKLKLETCYLVSYNLHFGLLRFRAGTGLDDDFGEGNVDEFAVTRFDEAVVAVGFDDFSE